MTSTDFTDKVVVGTDGSAAAERAIEWAGERANRDRRALVVLTVIPSLVVPSRSRIFTDLREGIGPDEHLERARQRASRRLDDIAADLTDTYPDLTCTTLLESGDGAQVLAQATRCAALVVVGTRGNSSPMRQRLLGGTADAVVCHAYGPVVAVPTVAPRAPRGPVVVGVDPVAGSGAAVRQAAHEAAAAGVDLIVVHSWELIPTHGIAMENFYLDEAEVNEAIRSVVEPLIDVDITVRYDLAPGHPAGRLIDYSHEAALVVVGSRGRGGFTGLLLGSVSRALLHHSVCPVMVVRDPH